MSLPNLGSFPLVVTFGRQSGSAPFRCRFCLGGIEAKDLETQVAPALVKLIEGILG